MPYYSRGSLNELINTRYLTVGEVVRFGCQMASGLHNVHSKRLVLFDIKPDNVLLSDRGEAMISDFGLARRLSTAGTAGQDQFYFAMQPPEVFSRAEYTRAFDIYQFGMTLYRMCNGNEAFYKQFERYGTSADFDRDAFKFDVRNGRFPDRKAFEEHIPERLRKVIKHCLEPDPTDRPKAAIEVSNTLAEVGDKLDWQFSKVGNDRVWVRQDGEKEYSITVEQNGRALAVKKMNASGRCTKISEYCKAATTTREIRKFLGEHE
jgi:serine/threonine protein kinase